MSTEPADQRAHSVHLNPALRQIIDNLPAFVWCAAPDGAIAFLNRRGLEYTGFSLDEVTGWNWKDTNILHADDGDALFDAWHAIVASGREGEIQARMRRFDGEYRWFLFRVAPQFDESGTLTAWWGVDVEIDERKRAEDQVRHALTEAQAVKDQFELVIDTIPGLVWSSLPDGNIDFLNQRWREYTGLSLADASGWGWRAAIHPDDLPGLERYWRSILSAGQPGEYEARLRRVDGMYRWFLFRGVPLFDPAGTLVKWYGQNTDIEDRKRVEALRQRSEDALNQVRSDLAHVTRVTTLGEMTASIAHEINQPLGAIVNNASAALRWLSADEIENARLSMALVVADGHRASEILQRVRAMVQKSPPHKQPVDLNDAVREVLMLVASQAARHGVSIESRLADGMPAVDADRVQIQQVVLNLVMNAIEVMSAMPAGQRRVTVASSCDGDAAVHVSIHDQGAGFSPEESERLFEPFYSTKPHGLGMGLAISRGIVQAHRGELWATANTNGGATFEFTLPLATRES